MKKKLRYDESPINISYGMTRWKCLWDDENNKEIYEEYNAFEEITFYI